MDQLLSQGRLQAHCVTYQIEREKYDKCDNRLLNYNYI